MAELLAYLARQLVDDPDAVRVERDGAGRRRRAAAARRPDDIGKVIGRQGRIARALRTVVRAGGRPRPAAACCSRSSSSGRGLVSVGRVGRPHGLAGAFFVEQRERGAERLRDGRDGLRRRRARRRRPVSKRAAGGRPGDPARPAGRARRRARGPARGAAAARGGRLLRLPARRASRSRKRAAASSGASRTSMPGRRERLLVLDSDCCCRSSTTACAKSTSRRHGSSSPRASRTPANLTLPVQLDVFTLVPHAFAWLTEHRPLATVLGSRARAAALQLPRHDAACARGRSTTSRTAAGPGCCSASTWSRPRSTRSTATAPGAGRRAHAAGAAARPGARRGARRGADADPALGALRGLRRARSSSTCAPTRSRSARTSSPAASCRRWCSLDAVARRLPGRSARGVWRAGELLGRARRRPRVPALHAAGGLPRLAGARVLLSGDHGRIDGWRREQSRARTV